MLEGRRLVPLDQVKNFDEIYWWKPEEQAEVMEMARNGITAEDIVALCQVDGWVLADEVMAALEEAQQQDDLRKK